MARKTKSDGMVAAMPPDDSWRVEDDLRTLQRAAEVRADAARMKKALALHAKQSKGLQSIAGGRPAPAAMHQRRDRLAGKKL